MATKEDLQAVTDKLAADVTAAVAEITALIAAKSDGISAADLQPIVDKLTATAAALEAAPQPPVTPPAA